MPEHSLSHVSRQYIEEFALKRLIVWPLTSGILIVSQEVFVVGDAHRYAFQILDLIGVFKAFPQYFLSLRPALVDEAVDGSPRLQPIELFDALVDIKRISREALSYETPDGFTDVLPREIFGHPILAYHRQIVLGDLLRLSPGEHVPDRWTLANQVCSDLAAPSISS